MIACIPLQTRGSSAMKLPRGIPFRGMVLSPKGTPRGGGTPLGTKWLLSPVALKEMNLRVCTNPHHRQVLTGNISDNDHTNATRTSLLRLLQYQNYNWRLRNPTQLQVA